MTEWCELSIYKKIKLKMCDINAHSSRLIKCVKWVNIEIADVTAFVALFMKNECDNDLLLSCF